MTSETTAPEPAYGGFWIRVVARLIDGILLVVLLLIIEVLLRGGTLQEYESAEQELRWLLFWVVAQWLYFAGLHASPWQATLGKRMIGMRVVGPQGERISFLRATGRYLAEIPSWMILMIGYLMVAFMPRKQGLHDLLASTFVVHADDEGPAPMDARARNRQAQRERISR